MAGPITLSQLLKTCASGAVVAYGELLIRLSAPGNALLLQSPGFESHIGGAEANVAIGLACLDHPVRMATVIPDNPLGRGALAALRAQGVDCSQSQYRAGRMGLYFLAQGAGQRASEVVYDRLGSSFADAPVDAIDWDRLLDGAGLLHMSGVTPALGPSAAESALRAATAATRLGVPVSFDGNFRATLWRRWHDNPGPLLRELMSHASILFGNHRDMALVLGKTFDSDGESRRRAAAEAAFAAFPRLQLMASTARTAESADRNILSARIDARDTFAQTAEVEVSGIVDRIGAGDAFAAGVLHAMRRGESLIDMASTGLALSCLKHTLPGDASLFRIADLDAFRAGQIDVRR